MSYDSKAQHEFNEIYLSNYQFGIFTGDAQIPLRQVSMPEGRASSYNISLHAKNVQLDLDDGGSGFGWPIDNSVYTKINQFPYLLRDSFSTGGDDGGPGFTYYLQQSDAGYFGEGGYINLSERARESGISEYGGVETSRRFLISALDAGEYPVSIGPELRLGFNYKLMKESGARELGFSVTARATKIQAFYLSSKAQMTQVLSDCVYHEQYDDTRGTELIGVTAFPYQSRAVNFFAVTGDAPHGEGSYRPFRDIVKSSTFIATGLPYFDSYGFMDIKDGDFTHLQSNKAAGSQDDDFGYQTINRSNTNLELLLEYGFDDFNDKKKYAPNYYWDSDYPTKTARLHFENYFRGNGEMFYRDTYDTTEAPRDSGTGIVDGLIYGSDTGESAESSSGLLRLIDKSLHYRFDPSCVPYTSFRIHYDLSNADISVSAAPMAFVYHPTYRGTGTYIGDDALAEWLPAFGSTTGGSYAYKYNLESAICGRLPPVFTLQAKLNSAEIMSATGRTNDRIQMYAASYDNSLSATTVSGDAGEDSYTTFEKTLAYGNMYLKSHYPFPWDGNQRFADYNTDGSTSFGVIGAAYPYDVTRPPVPGGSLSAWREYFTEQQDRGRYYMAWSGTPGYSTGFAGQSGYYLALKRYKAALRVFFGTKDMNAINCFQSLKKHVDKLSRSWTYDSEPKEARIRMQKRLPFEKSDFTSISEGYSGTETEGTVVTLDDEAATTSGTAVLPDDMGGADGVY